MYLFVLYIFFLNPPFVCFSFSLLEFINGVYGLGWLCRRGIVAYYVECTNVVKKWSKREIVLIFF